MSQVQRLVTTLRNGIKLSSLIVKARQLVEIGVVNTETLCTYLVWLRTPTNASGANMMLLKPWQSLHHI